MGLSGLRDGGLPILLACNCSVGKDGARKGSPPTGEAQTLEGTERGTPSRTPFSRSTGGAGLVNGPVPELMLL